MSFWAPAKQTWLDDDDDDNDDEDAEKDDDDDDDEEEEDDNNDDDYYEDSEREHDSASYGVYVGSRETNNKRVIQLNHSIWTDISLCS